MRIIAHLSMLGCLGCSDSGLTRHNATPIATITSHVDGEAVAAGGAVSLRGSVSDPDHPEAELLVAWFFDDVAVCEGSEPDETGLTTCTDTAPAAAETIRLEVRDPEGAAAVDVVSVVVEDAAEEPEENTPPSCSITAPITGETTPGSLTLEGQVSDAQDEPEDLTVQWLVDGSGLGAGSADAEGWTSAEVMLDAGEHTLALQATDTAGLACEDTVSVWVEEDVCPGLHLDASGDQYVEISAAEALVTASTSLSIEAWVKWDGPVGNLYAPIASQGWGDDATARFFFSIVGEASDSCGSDVPGQVRFELLADGDDACVTSSRRVPVGQWAHVAAVFDSGELRVFINGQLDAQTSITRTEMVAVSPGALWLGSTPSGDTPGLGGILAGVLLSDGVRYAADFTPAWPPSPDVDASGLWRLDDGDDVVTDSASVNDGTLIAGTWSPDCPDVDLDGDGYLAWEDCDDDDADIYPWAGDVLGDEIDGDCDGLDCQAESVDGVYWAVCDEPGTWPATRAACQDAGYDDLATFSSTAEQQPSIDLLMDIGNPVCEAAGVGCPWIGYTTSWTGSWQWADGTALGFENWASPEPNGDGDCAHINRYGDGGWNDTPCEIEGGTFGMVCERILSP